MVRPAGFEPATLSLEGFCSIQLSYERTEYKARYFQEAGAADGTRTRNN